MRMWIKAFVPLDVDITKVWDDVRDYDKSSLAGEDNKYVVYYSGEVEDGLKAIHALCKYYDVKIQAVTHP